MAVVPVVNSVAGHPNASGGDPWYLRLVHALPDIAGIMGGAVAAIALAGLVRSRYRRTLGRRRDAYERLSRLGIGVTLEFFTSILGSPPAIKRQITSEVWESTDKKIPKDSWECFYIDRAYYVQAIADEHETVESFSVTTRRRQFNPVFYGTPYPSWWERVKQFFRFRIPYEPLFKVKLGKTRFTDIKGWGPPRVSSWLGPRAAAYSEFHYFGNPGYYRFYVFTASTAGTGKFGDLGKVAPDAGLGIGGNLTWEPPPGIEGGEQDFEAILGLAAFRQETAITTYTVIGGRLSPDDYPSSFGPYADELRSIP